MLLGGKIIEKTSFAMPKVNREHKTSAPVQVDGRISGRINGTVSGFFRGTIEGDTDLRLFSGKLEPLRKDRDGTDDLPAPERETQPAEREATELAGNAPTEPEGEAETAPAESAAGGREDAASGIPETELPSGEPVSERPEGGKQL